MRLLQFFECLKSKEVKLNSVDFQNNFTMRFLEC